MAERDRVREQFAGYVGSVGRPRRLMSSYIFGSVRLRSIASPPPQVASCLLRLSPDGSRLIGMPSMLSIFGAEKVFDNLVAVSSATAAVFAQHCVAPPFFRNAVLSFFSVFERNSGLRGASDDGDRLIPNQVFGPRPTSY